MLWFRLRVRSKGLVLLIIENNKINFIKINYMNKPITFILLLSLTITLLTLISRKQHLLSILLCLENIILIIITYLPLHCNYQSINIRASTIILLTLNVCSARIGLTLLIIISRKNGRDSRLSYTIRSC